MNAVDFAKMNMRAETAGNALLEVCGAFWSEINGRLRIRYLPNRSRKSGAFALHRKDLRFVQSKGPFWGVFHSHPLGAALPSDEEVQKGFGMTLVYSDLTRDLRIWGRRQGACVGLDVRILARQRPSHQ